MIGKKKRAFSLLEIIIVFILLSIIITFAANTYLRQKERADKESAILILTTLQQEARDYYLRTRSYPSSFDRLNINNPNNYDDAYTYSISGAGGFRIRACRRGDSDACIAINIHGHIVEDTIQ